MEGDDLICKRCGRDFGDDFEFCPYCAIELVEGIKSDRPFWRHEYFDKSIIFFYLNNYEVAIKSFNFGMRIFHSEDDYFILKSYFFSYCEEYEKAIECVDKAIEINPSYNYFQTKAEYLEYLGKIKEAKENYKQSIKICQDSMKKHHTDNYYEYTGIAKGLKKLEKYEEAITYYKKALAINNFASWNFLAIIECLEKLGKYSEALEIYDKLIIDYPDDEDYLKYREEFLEKNKKYFNR